jgi:hypothetical protein
MIKRNRKWSPEDEERLLDLRASAPSWTMIAVALQQTDASVESRAYTLNNRSDPEFRRPPVEH